MIGLCDADAFYVSCERLFDPSLHGKPVVCLSNNDGAIIARSNEAKALGIKMGQPLFQVSDLVKQHAVIVKSSNYALYGDISRRVMSLIAGEVPDSAVYSIDEIFVDLDGMKCDLTEWARKLRTKIKHETGIPVGIGISRTKTLAKVANRLAKKSSKANGVLVLDDQKWIDLALARTEVSDVWGIGRRYSQKLAGMGISRAIDLRDMPDAQARSLMAVGGLRTVRELRGVRCIPLDDNPDQRETVCVSRSMGKEISGRDELNEVLNSFAGRACSKLRRLGLFSSRAQIFILSNRFKSNRPQFSRSCEIGFHPATNDTRIMCRLIGQNLNRIWAPGLEIKKAGILLVDICRPEDAPVDLFSIKPDTNNTLMAAIDKLSDRFGRNAVTIGRVPKPSGQDWYMTSSHRSPSYTTRWSDIPIVR